MDRAKLYEHTALILSDLWDDPDTFFQPNYTSLDGLSEASPAIITTASGLTVGLAFALAATSLGYEIAAVTAVAPKRVDPVGTLLAYY